MADRVLPQWMSKGGNHGNSGQKQTQKSLYKKNILEDSLQYLEFSGTVVYSCEKNDCSFLSEDLRSCLTPASAVGFDMEWPPSFTKGQKQKVALIQLCVSEQKCYLFHLSSMLGFPAGLKMLLEDDTIKKVGLGIEGDMWRLLSDFDIKLKNFLELTDLANEKLRCAEKWSLDGLVKHLFNQQLKKDRDVRCSSWNDFDLTEEQKRYAATDAYAGLIVYNKLQTMSPETVSQVSIKEKLLCLASEMEELSHHVPEDPSVIPSIAEVVDDMAVKLGALRDSLLGCDRAQCTSKSQRDVEEQDHSQKATAAGCEPSRIVDGNLNIPRQSAGLEDVRDCQPKCGEGVMSLDISEYELQMLEMQAWQEEMEEQSTLEFQDKKALNDSADLSCLTEGDEDLDQEMLQCAEDAEELFCQGDGVECRVEEERGFPKPVEDEDEEEGIEVEEEEGFDPSIPGPNSEQIKCLKKYFGHSSFKPVQWKAIYSILNERRDNLVVMATGYGKSLCFQFPPVYCGGVSVVISPLIALMEDQVLQLTMSNIPACFLGSAQTNNVMAGVKKGCYRIVYMTPEFCSGNTWLLEQLDSGVGISVIAIDEAHCISEWGHDFRGAYRNLGNLKKILADVPILALTATASPSVRDDIVKSLKLVDPVVTCTSFDRPNIFLGVRRKSGDILQDLKQFLIKKNGLGGDYEFDGSAIVYCPSRKEAERVSSELYKLGVLCGVYHAGMGIVQRRETQQRFMRDEIQCIVATVAFGMGINKADIRKVIHYGAPKEMESYYQEIGRAGRDGLPSSCHVLWAPGDMVLNRFLLSKVKSDRFRGYKMKMMTKMEQYLSSYKCRRRLILSHFEDKQLRKVTSGIMETEACCDNCKSGATCGFSMEDSKPQQYDFGKEAYDLMSAVSALNERFGTAVPILLLRGSGSQRLPDSYRKHPLFGAGRNRPEVWWKALTRQLIGEGYLKEATGHSRFSMLCKLTSQGKTWLRAAESAARKSLLLQPEGDLISLDSRPRSFQTSSVTASVQKAQPILFPSPESSKVARASSASVCRSQPASSYKSPVKVTKPPCAAVSPRELELQTELYGKLVTGRQKLASEKDIPPAILATNKVLLDMAKVRPCSLASLRQVDGVSEAKSSMLVPLLGTIREFCQAHRLQAGLSPSSAAPSSETAGPASGVVFPHLSDSVAVTYRLFQEERKSLRQVCDQRSLPVAVVESHLLQALQAGCPLDTDRAGLSAPTFAAICRIITNSDLGNMKAIRALVPEEISTFLIQLTVTRLQQEAPPSLPSAVVCSPHNVATEEELTWIEPKGKPVTRETHLGESLKSPKGADPDEAAMSDDELFYQISMPEEADFQASDVPCSSKDVPASKSALRTTGIELASWNQSQLDQDTQELFSDFPVKVFMEKELDRKADEEPSSTMLKPAIRPTGFEEAASDQPRLERDPQQQPSESPSVRASQPSKRRLPDWCSQRASVSSAAGVKQSKKKKGLFM
ncbi:Werner syndrome ATP-dependent helicase homolog isoform X2 [Brienomyrus brachyistius]|uniref:Werner syndrome ATP-dependent helicase homolog isoform X2 n=1 Tax=Brienomyrus brachyistius TaxID=42636 RepID=UPI0020B2A59D|nr:Werner syndrome ATP-dependent helicase homolog isoform X2 [Brienomyrus brachyistius]